MTVHEEELLRRIRELEKENGYLHRQIKEQRYGLTWIDVPEAFEKASENKIPVLEEVKDKSFTDGSEKPTHILIEGDNYHALTCLQYTHKGKIDVIYIDPPYNTGSDGFTYKDKRFLEKYPDGTPVPKDHPLRHSYWLSFMHKRLELAKNLLSDDGVIFISIDDNEQANMKLLCDKVFGEKNFVATYFWKRTSTPPALSYKVRKKLEYVLCYQKRDVPQRSFAQGYVDGGDVPLLNTDNPMGTLLFPKGTVHFGIDDGIYSFSKNHKIELLDDVIVKDKINANDFHASGHFKWGQKHLLEEIEKGTYFLIKSKQFSPRFQKSIKSTKVPSNIIDDEINVGTNEDAKKELESLDLDGDFEYAKPTSLISFLVKMPFWDNPNITILDFFAGSGTTLHATLKLNEEDGGNRQCILVQQNEGEKRICEEVTYERNRRVMQGYTNAKGEQVAGLGGSLKYYRTAFTGTGNPHRDPIMLPSDEDRISLAKNAGVLVSLAENTLYEIFRNDYYQIFTNNQGRFTAVYLQEDLKHFEDFRQEMEKLAGNVTVYIFSWGNNPDAANAFMHLPNVEVKSYPNAILDAYKSAMQQIESQK